MGSAVKSVSNVFSGNAGLKDILKVGGIFTGQSGLIKQTTDFVTSPLEKKRKAGQELNRQTAAADTAIKTAATQAQQVTDARVGVASQRRNRIAGAYGMGGQSLMGGAVRSSGNKTVLGA
jgi:hypothetical protein